jgi:MFS family permease
MSRLMMFTLFYLAVFLQAGAYGLTFLLPPLFDEFGANEKVVGGMLFLTTISTLITVYYAGHLSDVLGRMRVLGIACLAISASLAAHGMTHSVGPVLYFASAAMGFGWGLTYALTSVVLTRLVRADERVRYFAVQSVALMAGFGLSPVMAAQMERAGFAMRDAFFLTAALCTIAALVFFALIRPVRLHSEASGPETRSSLSPDTVF